MFLPIRAYPRRMLVAANWAISLGAGLGCTIAFAWLQPGHPSLFVGILGWSLGYVLFDQGCRLLAAWAGLPKISKREDGARRQWLFRTAPLWRALLDDSLARAVGLALLAAQQGNGQRLWPPGGLTLIAFLSGVGAVLSVDVVRYFWVRWKDPVQG